MGDRVMRRPEYPVPVITLAPFGTVGLRFDVARFYPGLHQSGKYRLVWRPYGGAVESEPLVIDVVQYKQVMMETEYGSLAIELMYDKAPRHVANFLELVDQRFYNGKTFHTVYPGQFILGGCPKGDGTGRRPDGMRLAPEFNDTPFEEGTVGMALIEGDPNSGSSQFFICLGRQASWDGRYTAFGHVRGPQSLATLQKLGQVPVDAQHRPVKPLVIKSMTATDMPFPPRQTK
jgi:cyclophilin family peptidyl-prolyl cis-trans isomerase